MNQEIMGLQWGAIGAVSAAALLFGIAYNWFVAWLNHTDYSEGYTSFLVVCGVLINLFLATFLIGIINVFLVLLVFGCTGVPMIIGDLYRHIQARRKARQMLADALRETGSEPCPHQ